MFAQKPTIGQIIQARGRECRIYKIYAFGTVDVECVKTGECFRITGLSF